MQEIFIIKRETNITDCCLISFHDSQIVSIKNLCLPQDTSVLWLGFSWSRAIPGCGWNYQESSLLQRDFTETDFLIQF